MRRSRHVFPDHAHEGIYAIGMMEEGGSYCFGTSRTDSLVAAGQICLINPGQVHSGVPVPKAHISYRMLYVATDQMPVSAGGEPPRFRCSVLYHPALYDRLRAICRALPQGGDGLETESRLVDTLGRLLQSCGVRIDDASVGGERSAVRKAREMLAADLDHKVTLAQVARSVGLSRYYLLRTFKRETGLSPHTFRTQRRIDQARRLLQQGQSIADVALTTGFADQAHFTNKFRQFVGATPRQYFASDL